jgi:hypothetical protein
MKNGVYAAEIWTLPSVRDSLQIQAVVFKEGFLVLQP